MARTSLEKRSEIDMLLDNPLNATVRQSNRMAAADLFCIPVETAEGRYLLLHRYVSKSPERFFARDLHRDYLAWLENRLASDPRGLREYMCDNLAEIERAILFAREINLEDWHDDPIDYTRDWDLLRFIDTKIHRVYLRLVEGVLTPLSRVVAYFNRLDRCAGTDGLDTYAVAKELVTSPLAMIMRSYHPTLRNGIGHGGITYRQNEVSYRDKRGTEATLGIREIVRLCDDLLDDCNGLIAALAVFLVQHMTSDLPVPEELLVQELAEEAAAPWWSIEAAVRSEIPTGSQLLIFARTSTHDLQKIQFSMVQTGMLAEALMSGYDRYYISLRGKKSLGWAALRGDRLCKHRVAGEDIGTSYSDALESFFFNPIHSRPRWFRRVETIVDSLRMNWPAARREWHRARGIPRIVPRYAKMHPNGWRSVLHGAVVIEHPDPAIIRKHRCRIIRCMLGIATPAPMRARYYPLGFAQVAVYCNDFRTRRLSSFGLGDDLVCTVRYQTIGRIHSPDIAGATVEIAGSWRIAWNRAWLDREQIALDTPPPWHTYLSRGSV